MSEPTSEHEAASSERIAIRDLVQLRELSEALVRDARRSLELVSRDLEPRVYDQPGFLEAVRALVLRGRGVKIRMLIRDVQSVIKNDHRLLDLAQRLSSYIEIRCLAPEDQTFNEAFLIVDGSGYIHRSLADRPEGEACRYYPLRARELGRVFGELWDRSVTDPNLRRLYL